MEVETTPKEKVAESKENDMDKNTKEEIKEKENSTVNTCENVAESQKNDKDKDNEEETKAKENEAADTLQRLSPPKPRPLLKLGKRTRQRLTRDNLRKSTSILPVVSFYNKLKKKREEKKKGPLQRRNTVNK